MPSEFAARIPTHCMARFPLVVATSLFATFLAAQNDPPKPDAPKPDAPQAEPEKPDNRPLTEVFAKFHPVSDLAKVGSVAEVKLPAGWLWLNGKDGRDFLTMLGNQPGPSTLGVAIPGDFQASRTFAVYSYAEEGHVSDDENPDYAALLAGMKDNADENEARKQAGLATVAVLGWAEAPHYDKDTHKMYWAMRLKFSDSDGETLNYNTRVLGRTGHLVVYGVGGMQQLPAVSEMSKTLLGATEFVEGKRYTDFKPEYDKIAAYGIGGLIAGKVALKIGLFAKLGLVFVKFLKPILIGLAVLGGAIAKIFTGRKKKDDAPARA